ncbi:MAG: hypothetical protein H6739_24260 [Alphaproteobacteria bacterium]|nr:hypothetical protein [Alphaproteobacteria bacterium]
MVTLKEWRSASDDDIRAFVGHLKEWLPEGLAVQEDGAGALPFCNEEGFVVVRDTRVEARTFVLVPGGAARLGFDAEAWEIPSYVQKHWDLVRAHLPGSFHDVDLRAFVGARTSSPRDVALPALLVQRASAEVGWEPLPSEDPRYMQLLGSVPRWAPAVLLHSVTDDGELRVRGVERPGYATVERRVSVSHAQVVETLAAAGQRLLSADEWEYACGGGTGQLFAWGPDCVLNGYPDDLPLSAFFQPNQRHPFGLHMPWGHTTRWELVQDPDLRMGGDGGLRVSASVPFLEAWLPVATAWREVDRPPPDFADGAWVRRVVPLDPELRLRAR